MSLTPWATLADRAIVACRNTFATAVEYPRGSGYMINVVFDDAYKTQTVNQGVAVSTTRPCIDIRLADLLTAPIAGDLVVVNGRNAEISDVQPGGLGSAKCFLTMEDEL